MATKKRMERTKHSKRIQRDAEYQRMVEAAAKGFSQAFEGVSINLNIEQLVGRVDVTTLRGLQDSDLHALRDKIVQQLVECCITALGSFQQRLAEPPAACSFGRPLLWLREEPTPHRGKQGTAGARSKGRNRREREDRY